MIDPTMFLLWGAICWLLGAVTALVAVESGVITMGKDGR